MEGLRNLVFVALLAVAQSASASTGSANVSSACATLEFMAKMVTLNAMLPHYLDDIYELEGMEYQLMEMNSLVCQPAVLTGYTRGNSTYANGYSVSADLYYDPWYFPNGQLFFQAPAENTTIYYPNGRVMAYHWMHGNQPIFWPNGELATEYFRTYDVTWYYPDGNIITYDAGYSGGAWFYPFSRLDGRVGQEAISRYWGLENEDFTFLNFTSEGYLFTTKERIRRRLIFDDYDLLDVPGVLLLVTRLYQFNDTAKQFTPADINITGAPY